jgi:butyryl-CoA dehydrogenase
MCATVDSASGVATFAEQARALDAALNALRTATEAAWSTATPDEALANATPYLQAFGHVVLAWLWLDVALAAAAKPAMAPGKHAAMRYFFAYELPKIDAWLSVVSRREPLLREMQDEWF